MRTRRLPAALAAAALLCAAATARAETREVDSLAVGWMTETADLTAVVEPVAPGPGDVSDLFRYRVVEVVRGTSAPAEIAVRVRTAPAREDEQLLVFVSRTGAGEWVPVSGAASFKRVDSDDEAPLVAYARSYAATLTADGRVGDPAELAGLLVRSLGSEHSGVPFCAGRDLVRHEDVIAALGADGRRAIGAALAAPRKADQDLASIVIAAGVAGDADVAPTLVRLLVSPATSTLRRHLVAALRRHASADVVALLSAELPGGGAVVRADVANALGGLARRDAAPPLVALLRDDDRLVRLEAVHGLGLLARAVRAPASGAPDEPRPPLDGVSEPLRRRLAEAGDHEEAKAALWALAQVDTQDAWDVLRKMRDDAADPAVRELAAELLRNPRVSLVLDSPRPR